MSVRSREPVLRPGTRSHTCYEYGLLLMGSLVVALSFNLLLSPNQIASGGVSGISILVHTLTGIQPAYTQWALNLPLFVAGFMLLGKRFGLKTAVGSFVLPLLVLLTRHLPPLTTNPLLASLYGGIGIGAGLGIVFRGRGSTGGLDLAAQIIHKYTGLSLGIAVAMLDGLVILTAGFVYSPEKAMYALLGLFMTGKTIDVLQLGFRFAKVAYIITKRTEELERAILFDLDRGLTRLSAIGGYTGNDRPVLMVVVGQREVMRLKLLVKAVDPGAFVILTHAAEVLGEGFKRHE